MTKEDDPTAPKPEVQSGGEMGEVEIDSNLEDTFPASDPPSWTLGTNHGRTHLPSDEEPGESS